MNIDLTTPAGIIAFVILVAQFIGKMIPDSATGVLGTVRSIAKVVGIYVPNRQ